MSNVFHSINRMRCYTLSDNEKKEKKYFTFLITITLDFNFTAREIVFGFIIFWRRAFFDRSSGKKSISQSSRVYVEKIYLFLGDKLSIPVYKRKKQFLKMCEKWKNWKKFFEIKCFFYFWTYVIIKKKIIKIFQNLSKKFAQNFKLKKNAITENPCIKIYLFIRSFIYYQFKSSMKQQMNLNFLFTLSSMSIHCRKLYTQFGKKNFSNFKKRLSKFVEADFALKNWRNWDNYKKFG